MRVFLTARAPLSRTCVTGSSIVSTSMAACGAVSYACRWEADGRTGRCSINGWTADATKFPPPRDFLLVSRRGHWQQPIQGPAGAIDSAGVPHKKFSITGRPSLQPHHPGAVLCSAHPHALTFICWQRSARQTVDCARFRLEYSPSQPAGAPRLHPGVAPVPLQGRRRQQDACRGRPFAPPHHKGVAQALQVQSRLQARAERPRQGYVTFPRARPVCPV